MSAAKFQKIGRATLALPAGVSAELRRLMLEQERQRHYVRQLENLRVNANPYPMSEETALRIATTLSEQMNQEVSKHEEQSKMLTTTFIPKSEPRLQDLSLASVMHLARRETDVHWEILERSYRQGFWPFKHTVYRYQILFPTGGFEYQVINLGIDGDEAGIRYWISAREASAYLWGAIGQFSTDSARFIPASPKT